MATPAAEVGPKAPATLRIRNVGIIQLRVGDVLENPANFQEHPPEQDQALGGAVEQLGWFGYPDVFQVPDGDLAGRYMLVDGALRRSHLIAWYGEETVIDFNLTDFTPAEADLALATKDPIAKLARVNSASLDALLAGLAPASEALQETLDALADSARYGFATRWVKVSALTFHPRNYRDHPPDQIAHLVASIKDNRLYRNVVTARGGVVLVGQGVVEAATSMGRERIPVVELDVEPDDPRALKIMAADNEISRLAAVDDRALTELLKEIMGDNQAALQGTGFDPAQLAALVMTTRPSSEIRNKNEAAEWLGMPEYDEGEGNLPRLVISFPDEAERRRFCNEQKIKVDKKADRTAWSTRWPFTERLDTSSVRFEPAAAEETK